MSEAAAKHIQLILYVGFSLSTIFVIAVTAPYALKQFWHNFGGPCLVVGAIALFGLSLDKQIELDLEKGTAKLSKLKEEKQQLVSRNRKLKEKNKLLIEKNIKLNETNQRLASENSKLRQDEERVASESPEFDFDPESISSSIRYIEQKLKSAETQLTKINNRVKERVNTMESRVQKENIKIDPATGKLVNPKDKIEIEQIRTTARSLLSDVDNMRAKIDQNIRVSERIRQKSFKLLDLQ